MSYEEKERFQREKLQRLYKLLKEAQLRLIRLRQERLMKRIRQNNAGFSYN